MSTIRTTMVWANHGPSFHLIAVHNKKVKQNKIRNLISHRRGIVDEEFRRSTGSKTGIGQQIRILPGDLEQFLVLVGKVGVAVLKSAQSLEIPSDISEGYKELGRRICAALMSFRLGHAGVDYTLKKYTDPQGIGEYWTRLAAKLDRELAERIGSILKPID